MRLVWFDASSGELFLDDTLDVAFEAFSFGRDWFKNNPHIELIGAL